MINKLCPACGYEQEDYFANTDTWTVVQPHTCDCAGRGTSCGQSVEISEINHVTECESCGKILHMHARVRQQCGDNEIVEELTFSLEIEAKQ